MRQQTKDDVYGSTAHRLNRDLDLVESIGNFVFQRVAGAFREPPALNVKVDKLGTFRVRHKNLTDEFFKLNADKWDYADEDNNDFRESESVFQDYEKNRERYRVMERLMQDYERYRLDKAVVKKKRADYEDNI